MGRGRPSRHSEDPFRVATEALAGRPTRWQNLGLWRGTEDYETACEALAVAVGEAAGLGPGDRLVELACGAGAAFDVWRKRFGVAEVIGLEVDEGRAARASELGRVLTGPAIVDGQLVGLDAMGPFDAVVCVDAAYHLGSAGALATASHAALRPGGRLAFTTLTRDGNESEGEQNGWVSRGAGLSDGAIQSRPAWRQILAATGFSDVATTTLDDVLAGFVAHVGRRRRTGWRTPGWAKIEATALLARLGHWSETLGYTLVSATRRSVDNANR
jgi:cyclopropane fatty-acyl-phospholipid synthase-like methyltransferase